MTNDFSLIDNIVKDVFSKRVDRNEVIRQFETLSGDEKKQLLARVKSNSSGKSAETKTSAGIIDLDLYHDGSAPLIFQEYWQEVPPVAPETGAHVHASHAPRTIVFSDENWLNEPPVDASARLAGDIIYVIRGDRFQKLSDRLYCCRANDEVQLQTLFRRLVGEADKAWSVVYAWSKGKGEAGIHELFTLFKAVKPFAGQISQLTLLGHYDQQSPDSCWDYAWIGFQRTLKPHYPATVISIVYSETIAIDLKQAMALSARESVAWFRGEQAYRLSVRAVEVEQKVQAAALKQYGGYLITGGVGALGFAFACYLASHYQAKLILVGRRPLTDAIRKQLDELKQLGACEAVYEAVDVRDEAALKSLALRLPFELTGIIHAAGVESDKAFFEKSAADVRQVMGPKTVGTLLLDQAFGQQPLDFICYFSSSAALLGDFGGCDYAIANRFQMGYGAYREQNEALPGKTIVINWPLWDGAEGGMGARNKERADFYLKTSGQRALSARYGVPLWCDLVQAGCAQALVMIGDPGRITSLLQRFYEKAPHQQITESGENPVAVVSQPSAVKTMDMPDHELKAIVAADLKRLISNGYKIAIDRLEDGVHLAEYGLDSINLTELAQQLTVHFSIEITPALFFSYISIDQLSDYFVGQHRDHLQSFYRPASEIGETQDTDLLHAAAAAPSERFPVRQSNVPAEDQAQRREPIAIIGMAGRFPDADTVDELWALLSDGGDAIKEVPESRWNWRDYFIAPGDPDNKIATNRGGFIRDIEHFDPLFFDISPREAQDMDPAQRLLLMECYRAIEDAGLSPQSIRGSRTAVFVGMEESQHEMLNGWRGITTGGAAMIASRLSYFLDLHGPAIVTNTACSSGLVALHQAAMSLRQGECDTALVASVALTLSPHSYVTMSRAGMLSSDGRCRSFAANADGIGVGEAVVSLMLKPLAAAVADGNPIHGVLKASGINFDGKTNGVTAPNGKMQAELIERIYADNGIDIDNIGHIVAHGTGTKLGDPVELNALHDAFKMLRDRKEPRAESGSCAITSCKGNLGHTMAASGLVSVVSLLQSMRHNRIPASLHCEEENPHFNRANSSFYINKSVREWHRIGGRPRLGAVSAFGRSGTNAHVVIEEYPPVDLIKEPGSRRGLSTEVVIPLSARTAEQLRQRVHDLLLYLSRLEADDDSHGKVELADIAYTLQVGRDAMAHRLGVIVASFSALKTKLHAYLDDATDIPGLFRTDARPDPQHARQLGRDRATIISVKEWLAARKLPDLLQLWAKGLDVDWERLYGDDRPRRISLPGYPFAGETYRHAVAPVGRARAARESDGDETSGDGEIVVSSTSAKPIAASGQSPLVIIGGAGLFGLCMGVFLKKANIPFRIIEKNEDVGGVWYVNRWPGCGCDIPMLAYAYSFEHFTGDIWAKQPDILEYLQSVARKYDLYSHITFNTKIKEADWQEDLGQWLLTFENEETIAAKYYIHAANEGQGHVGNIPNIPGMNEFQGSLMHALECRADDWDFKGKRIAIIGNGTTQIQLVEALQPIAERLVVYARSPKYIYPRATYGRPTQQKLGSDYQFWLKHRSEYLATADEFYAVSNDPVQLNPFHPDTQVERYFSRDMNEDWRSFYQWLREIDMVPDYSPGCSRPCMSHTYHRQIRADNVELKTVPATRITATGIETENDTEAFDIILLATGYDLNEFKPRITIRGRNGLELNDYFGDFPKSYAGMAVSHFPNFFLSSGPNSGSNVTSITAIYEQSCENLLQIIRYSEANHLKSLEIKEEEAEKFVAFIRERNQTGSFSSGCSSWFQTKKGENAAVFPGTFEELKQWRKFDPQQYHLEYEENGCTRGSVECSDRRSVPRSRSPILGPALRQLQEALARRDPVQKLGLLEEKLQLHEIEEMETLLAEMLISSLISMGVIGRRGVNVEAWLSDKQPVPFFERWLDNSIRYLQRQHWLDDASVLTHEVRSIPQLWQEWESQKGHWLANPALKSQVVLLEVCLSALPGILGGKKLATDVIFPNASMVLVEGIYQGNPLADYYNDTLADALAVCVEQKQQVGQIRILEIGAGTGGTTARLLPLLQSCSGSIAEYCYTDVSKAFLKHAEKRYRPQFPALTTALFDVSEPLTSQGINPDHYDMVIATNVLHATPDIRMTVRHAKAALKRNGVLLLNELSTWSLFNHLTFGLLDGWWLHKDGDLRLPGCPGLSPETWQRVLSEEGFELVVFPASNGHRFGQQIIAAGLGGKQTQDASAPPEPFATGAGGVEARPEIPSQGDRPGSREVLYSREVTERMMMDHIQRIITEKLSVALEIDPDLIAYEASFADYGIDSILGVEFVQAVNAALQVKLETTNLFDYSSVEKLSNYVASVWGTALKAQVTRTSHVAQQTVSDHTPAPANEMAEMKRPVFDAGSKLQTSHADDSNHDPIAIIGMSGRFAESESLEAFWQNLKDSKDLVKEVSRWDKVECFGAGSTETEYCSRGSFVDSIDLFDAGFFRISPLEAMYMDPQQRLFLEESWKALEDAGYAGKSMDKKRCGVFAGCTRSDYAGLFSEDPPPQAFWGNAGSVIPARIAYFLNLQGPAISVDTACSSSLVSIHLACQSLWSRETEMALAGGIFLQLAPDYYQVSNRAGMLSPEGKCHAFDARANGFVPGEGVGVVVLKRLRDALQDGDSVHGLIVGSGTNQDGSTNGITAPSAQSQQRLELSVYERFNINPETIQLLEAHGTGTRLGDPVEFTALTNAFRQYTDKKQFCAIGSVKTNIGHATLAAGIAGVLKILMAMKHRQIPASLHFQEANPAIDFPSSPFYPSTRLSDWHVADGQPRRAAISSFGLSGTNAHMVIEEMREARPTLIESPGYLVALSARTADQLKQQIGNLLAFCKQSSDVSMNDMSHTLFVGRLHLGHRFACIARNQAELLQLLEQELATAGKAARDSRIYSSVIPEGKVREQGSLKKYGNQCIEECRHSTDDVRYLEHLATIADLYVQGYELDFQALFAPGSKRIALPTYPFAKERHWVDAVAEPRPAKAAVAAERLHPLLHRNTSDLAQQRYSSVFTGEEFFLKDHEIGGRKILPAVAYLEMVRAAVMQAMPERPEAAVLELRDTVWLQPLAVAASEHVSIDLSLMPSVDGRDVIGYEVYSLEEGERIVHSQGTAAFGHQTESAPRDIRQLQDEMGPEHVSAADLYAAFLGAGVNYGPAHQGVTSIRLANQQCLAELALPAAVENGHRDYELHPSLMDGALQASVNLLADLADVPDQISLPFALESLRVLSPCARQMFAWVRFAAGSDAGDRVAKLDIDLMDRDGRLCVRIEGLSFRALGAGQSATLNAGPHAGMAVEGMGSLLAVPAFEPSPAPVGNATHSEHHVILYEISADLPAHLPDSRCLQLQAMEGEDVAERYSRYALACFEQIRSILKSKPHGEVLLQLAVPDLPEQTMFAGLSGLLKSAALENPLIVGQVIVVDPTVEAEHLADCLRENQSAPSGTAVRYRDGVRQVQRWQEERPTQAGARVVFRDQGAYLIVGGLGGLGTIFTREILRQVPNAHVILTGRAPLTEQQKVGLEALSPRRDAIDYRQLDICDARQVAALLATIQGQYKRLNGILHCAGMIADQFILTKTEDEFRRVLAPKVTGTWYLDQASRHLDLDFFVLFSSQASAMGSMGQTDYAAANGFMDQFAGYRNRLVAEGERRGQTLSVNWPLWQHGGMAVDEVVQRQIRENTGMHPMRTETGLLAFYQSLGLGHAQVGVIEGDLPQIRQLLFGKGMPSRHRLAEAAPTPAASPAPAMLPASDNLLEKAQDFLSKQLSMLLKLPTSRIDPQAPLEQYGIDSILTVNLTNQLEKTFGPLSKTLLFEYQTIRELAEYFVDTHADKLAGLFAPAERQPAETQVESRAAAVPTSHALTRTPLLSSSGRRPLQQTAPVRTTAPAAAADEPIAIIGLSGRYPQAFGIREYWQNLRDGKDCITEVPKERWDWRDYFSEDRSQFGYHFSKWGGFIEGVDEFDPFFFNMSPREAEYTDPQERLFLQHAWMAVEDAGYTRAGLQIADEQDLAGQVGVYVGVMYGEYQLFGAEASMRGNRMGFAGSLASIANRVSYVLNLHGPSMTLDTMCSSSLTAIHLACQDLKQRRTSLAIAGGVNTTVHPNKYLMLSAGQFISSEGRCQSFGVGGDGYIPAEGVGVVVLKRLSDAQKDQDHIYGVIKSSALNHGGKTNGYTVPNPQAQTAAIRRALAESGTDPRHISYIEAHGTGTKLGDPIEIAGLTKAFGQFTKDTGFCFLGSAKSNIGHGESAAGIAGLTKVLLQMKHQEIAPSLHSAVLNPNIDFDRTPFVVNQSLRPWENPMIDGRRIPRIAGISSFGAGGSNAHLIIEEYLDDRCDGRQAVAARDVASVIVLSAKNEPRLREVAENLRSCIAENPTLALSDVAYTLQVGREAMEERLGILASSLDQLSDRLQAWLAGEQGIEDLWHGQVKRNDETIALFSGDADLQETIDRWIAQGKYPKLLELWVKGLNPDWSKLYGEDRPHRISLPAYPFARDRYWTPEGSLGSSGEEKSGAPGSLLGKLRHSMPTKASPTIDSSMAVAGLAKTRDTKPLDAGSSSWDQLSYRPVWNERPVSQPVRQERQIRRILVVYGEISLHLQKDILAECRRNHPEANIVGIRLGQETRRVSDTEWSCGIDDADGFHMYLKDAHTPDRIFFIAGAGTLAEKGDRQIQYSAVNEIQLLRLVKALQQHNKAGTAADCFILTLDNHQPDDAPSEPEGGGLSGLAYALAQGDRRFLVRNIDLTRSDFADDALRRRALRMVLEEAPSDRGTVTKIKAGRRYQQSFLKWQWDRDEGAPGLREGGVYLIAGGSGTVGQIITRHLIERYRAKVVWLGRTAENDPALQKKLAGFRELGASLWYIRADVTQAVSLKQAIDKVKQKYPILNGAIFSSLVFHPENSIAGTTEREFTEIVDVKISGSRLFHAVLQDEPLDFLCYFSSVQSFSFLSAKDSAGYATGITFADAVARSQRHHGRFPVGIINWGYWQATVKGTPLEAPLSARFGLIEDEVGTNFFDRFISQLQKGGADQLLCMPASQPLQEMMGLKENEISYLSSQANPSLFARLKEEYYEQA